MDWDKSLGQLYDILYWIKVSNHPLGQTHLLQQCFEYSPRFLNEVPMALDNFLQLL
jgi:hypothetical protein